MRCSWSYGVSLESVGADSAISGFSGEFCMNVLAAIHMASSDNRGGHSFRQPPLLCITRCRQGITHRPEPSLRESETGSRASGILCAGTNNRLGVVLGAFAMRDKTTIVTLRSFVRAMRRLRSIAEEQSWWGTLGSHSASSRSCADA
jgi:hypothetical protein